MTASSDTPPPQQSLVFEALREAVNPAFVTDIKGHIVWINEAFSRCYGYELADVLGLTPRILKSGAHGLGYYQTMWAELGAGRPWSGETIDKAADGSLRTIRQTISPIRHEGQITHFLGIHTDITDQAELAAIRDLRAGMDQLTGLLTQSAFEERAREVLLAAASNRETPVLLMLTIRSANGMIPKLDSESTAFLYEVLGDRICGALREHEEAGTFGDFVFCVLLSRSNPDRARAFGQRLRGILEGAIPFLGETLRLRCAAGAATYPVDGKTIGELKIAAEQNLVLGASAVLIKSDR